MYWQKKWSREEDKDQALKDEILAIRQDHKDYGYRRIHLELKNRGWAVNKKKFNDWSGHGPSSPLLRQEIQEIQGLQRRHRQNQEKSNQLTLQYLCPLPKNYHRHHGIQILGRRSSRETSNKETLSRSIHGHVQSGNHQLRPLRPAQRRHHAARLKRSHRTKQGLPLPAHLPLRSRLGLANDRLSSHAEKTPHLPEHVQKRQLLRQRTHGKLFSLLKREIYDSYVYRSRQELVRTIEDFIRYYNNDRIKEKLGGLSPKQYRERMTSA